MTRHLPRSAPFRRLRRGIASVPSGLPTTAAAIAAVVLVGAQLLTVVHGLPVAGSGAEPIADPTSVGAMALVGPMAPPATTKATPRTHPEPTPRQVMAALASATHAPATHSPAGRAHHNGSSGSGADRPAATAAPKVHCPAKDHGDDDTRDDDGDHGHRDRSERGSERGRERSCRAGHG